MKQNLNQMLGRMLFFRAWLYFEWNNIVGNSSYYIDKVLGVMDETMILRATRQELFDLARSVWTIFLILKIRTTPELGKLNKCKQQVVKSRRL